VANLALKFAFIGFNQGEYTDGILQLTVFENKAGLYPPLYGALALALSKLGMGAEFAGRVISVVAGSLAVIPVYLLARRLRDDNAARFAGLFFTLCPLVLRWSLRVMSDSLFLCLSATVLWSLHVAWTATEDRKRAGRHLAAASILAALGSLTRYQGVFLTLPLLLVAGVFVVRHRRIPWLAIAASAAWGLLPAWIQFHGFVHQGQFAERSTGHLVATLLAWLNLGESFLLIWPYFLGFPIFLFAVAGLAGLRFGTHDARAFLWLWAPWTAAILVLQSVFGSFQYRYMMPVFPACLALAGVGAGMLETTLTARGRRWLFSLAFLGSVGYLVFFSLAVLVFQRQSLGDQRAAASILAAMPPGTPAYSNEQYGSFRNLGCVKQSYWSGRPVESIIDSLPERPGQPLRKHLPDGSVVILGNMYGGDQPVDFIIASLTYFYQMHLVASFDSAVYPIMDDIMLSPGLNQNPLAWVLRYTPQLFSTHIYQVDRRRTPEEVQALVRRQIPPPGTNIIRDGAGNLNVAGDALSNPPESPVEP
jgi:hypothetical protein